MNKLGYSILKKNAYLWTISKPFSCCDWYYKAVSKRYWNRKSQTIRGFTAVPLGSSGTLQSRRSPWNAVWLCKDSLSDNRRTAGGRKHLTTETVLFSSWGLWFLFLFRALCFRRHIRPLPHELDKGVLVELKGRGCRQFESYLLAQQRSWYEFFMDVLVAGGVMKRLDLCH